MNLINHDGEHATVELDLADLRLLTHLLDYAITNDALADAHDYSMALGYAEAMRASFETVGLAVWAAFEDKGEYGLGPGLDGFRRWVPITKEEHRRRQAEQEAEAPTP